MKNSKIKILVCCHKQCELPQNEIFLPIQVGAAISNIDLGMQRDDKIDGHICENISNKNKSYCELTAVYWAWKNIKKIYHDLEYIGLNHYRRYFAFDKRTIAKDVFIESVSNVSKYKIDETNLQKWLANGYTIVPKEAHFAYSLWTQYCLNHYSDDIKTLQNVIAELYPNYIPAFEEIVIRGNKFMAYNMTITSFDVYDSYCDWLFSILFEIEQRIIINNYNDFQKRIFGFMGERLFKVWLYKNQIKIKRVPIIEFNDNRKDISELSFIKRNLINNCRHYINKV